MASGGGSSEHGGGGGGGGGGGFGQALAQEVDNATAKWMKMISSTFLGESSASLFARRSPALTQGPAGASAAARRRRGPRADGLDDTRELKIALVGGAAVVRGVVRLVD